MAQWLSIFFVLPEDRVQFPAPTEQLTTICNSSTRKCGVHFWPLWEPRMHVVHRNTQSQNKPCWWYISLIPALVKQRKANFCEFELAWST